MTDEWRLQYEQRWCSGPVVVDGHYIPCGLTFPHQGPCIATREDVVKHRRGGQRVCVRSRCGEPIGGPE